MSCGWGPILAEEADPMLERRYRSIACSGAVVQVCSDQHTAIMSRDKEVGFTLISLG